MQYEAMSLVIVPFFGTTSRKWTNPERKWHSYEPDPSVVSFLPGLALMKITVLESMCIASYFHISGWTLYKWTNQPPQPALKLCEI